MKVRGVNRYCTACGSHMARRLSYAGEPHYDGQTGKLPSKVWWWGCSEDRDDGRQPYLEHSRSHRIKESGARAALRATLDALTEGLEPGPFHAVESGDKARYGWWLENAAGDSSFTSPEDVALMVNALPALLAIADALREIVRLGNQPGMDNDEWESAMSAAETALTRLEDKP